MPQTTTTARSASFHNDYPRLSALLTLLRSASDRAEAMEALEASTSRMKRDPELRHGLKRDCLKLLWRTDFTEVLDEVGMLSDQPLFSGVWSRFGGEIASEPGRDDMLIDVIDAVIERHDRHWLHAVQGRPLFAWVSELLRNPPEEPTAEELTPESPSERRSEGAGEQEAEKTAEGPAPDSGTRELESAPDPAPFGEENSRFRSPEHQLASACVVLASRITGTGANPRLLNRLPNLDNWDSPFVQLVRRVEHFAVWFIDGSSRDVDSFDFEPLFEVLDDCEDVILSFRSSKATYGTNLELSSLSLRVAQQIQRLRRLLALARAEEEERALAITELTTDVLLARLERFSVLPFVREKLDLVAYLTVGHAAKQGEKYVVYDQKEYAKFLRKSIGGGVLVAIFASIKLSLSNAGLAPLPQALIYGMNYAICFALIYLFGATLATKQPAVTASRLAESLEAKAGADDFPSLVQAIFRSQFISFVGNILGAAFFAIFIAFVVQTATNHSMVSEYKADKLLASLHPIKSPSVFYAAIAGVMLSLSGFIAGYVDNHVVFHRVADRIAAGTGLFQRLSPKFRASLSKRVNKKTGALTGNVVLGFMLGSAGAVGILLGLPFDIRHIAFASSHAALGLVYSAGAPSLWVLLVAFVSVLVIGFVNFIVSFLLTLAVAIESRKVKGVAWRNQLLALKQLIMTEPLKFLLAQPNPEVPRHDDPLP